jgi:LPXTG-motif cell wall-anchored protein
MTAFRSQLKNTPPIIRTQGSYDNFLGIGEGKRKKIQEDAETARLKLKLEADQTAAMAEIKKQNEAAALIADTNAKKAAATASGPSTTTIMLYVGGGIFILLAIMYFIKKRKK